MVRRTSSPHGRSISCSARRSASADRRHGETGEAITWTQLGLHSKRCGLLNVCGYYNPLLALFDQAVAEGLVKSGSRDIVVADIDPAALPDRLAAPMERPEPGGCAPLSRRSGERENI